MTEITVRQLQTRVALNQDATAYKQLFVSFYPKLISFARRQVALLEDAEDLVAEVMLKLWTMGAKLVAINNLLVYLYTAIRNSAINLLTKKTPHRYSQPIETEAYSLQCTCRTPADHLLKTEEKRQLQQAIDALPEKCRMVYQMIREDGLSYKEVAGILGISENTVDRHLNNALHKLVASLSTYFERKEVVQKKSEKRVGSWAQLPVMPVLPTIATPVWKGSYT